MDSLTLILISIWCGTPNLPMSSAKVNKQIIQCRKDLIDCYNVSPSSTTLVMCLKEIPKAKGE
jgi:hypothetical protein